jgi:hypothetical protein
MASMGISGTTLQTRNLRSFSSTDAVWKVETATSPLRFVRAREASNAASFCRRASSSSLETGRTNSREVQPERRMLQPRMVSRPASRGVPERRTVWKDPAGMEVERGSQVNGTPEVLQGGCQDRVCLLKRQTHLNSML